jgi:hypothetical protein
VKLAQIQQIFEVVGVVVLTGSCLVSCELEVMLERRGLSSHTNFGTGIGQAV